MTTIRLTRLIPFVMAAQGAPLPSPELKSSAAAHPLRAKPNQVDWYRPRREHSSQAIERRVSTDCGRRGSPVEVEESCVQRSSRNGKIPSRAAERPGLHPPLLFGAADALK